MTYLSQFRHAQTIVRKYWNREPEEINFYMSCSTLLHLTLFRDSTRLVFETFYIHVPKAISPQSPHSAQSYIPEWANEGHPIISDDEDLSQNIRSLID